MIGPRQPHDAEDDPFDVEPLETAPVEHEPLEDIPIEDRRFDARPSRPAPVIADDDYRVTVPERPRHLEGYDGESHSLRGSITRLLAGVLAIVVMLGALAFTGQQVTSPAVALSMHERGVQALTGIPDLLLIHEVEIREEASLATSPLDRVEIPSFLVHGVTLSAQEVETLGRGEWERLLTRRAAEVTYRSGLSAFREDGSEPNVGTFSTAGASVFLMGAVSEQRYEWFSRLVVPLAIAALAVVALIVLIGPGAQRFVVLGLALIIAAVPVALIGLAGLGLVAMAGSDGSAVADALSSMARTLAMAPLRNALWLALAGVLITAPAAVAAIAFDAVDRRRRAREVEQGSTRYEGEGARS